MGPAHIRSDFSLSCSVDQRSAEQHFERAATLHERWGMRPHLARTQVVYAELLVQRGARDDREKALGLVDRSLSSTQELGMARLAEQALALKLRLQGILSA